MVMGFELVSTVLLKKQNKKKNTWQSADINKSYYLLFYFQQKLLFCPSVFILINCGQVLSAYCYFNIYLQTILTLKKHLVENDNKEHRSILSHKIIKHKANSLLTWTSIYSESIKDNPYNKHIPGSNYQFPKTSQGNTFIMPLCCTISFFFQE